MIKSLLTRLASDQAFAEHELHLKFKVDFLNSVFLLATVVAFGMGFYRWQHSHLMGAVDFGFSAIGIGALTYLRWHREKVELISTLAIVLAFVLFFTIYMLAPYNTMRLALFFLLSAAAFYLKGRRTGLYWLGFILFAIVAAHLVPGLETGYSHIDIVTTCLYLIALFFIFWNYETVRVAQYKREQEHELQSRIDERWRLGLESAGDATWDWDIGNDRFHFSPNFTRMLGYDKTEIGDRGRDIEPLLHPAERERIFTQLKAYLKGDGGEQFSAEGRLRCKDGSYLWVLCRGRAIARDANGRVLRMAGTHVDISENKRIQEEILCSRQALADGHSLFQTILDNAPLGIWMVDTQGKIQFVNQSFCKATGISEARFVAAEHYSDVLPPSIAANCMQSDRECYGQETPHLSMEWLPFVDGGEHLLEITKVRLVNQDGSLRGLIGLAADITERQAHEQQLEHIAHYDALTGVPNRVLLMDRLLQALARTRRDKGLMAVCYLDLDGFKPINDSFGHATGDQVLIEVARRLRGVIREEDTVARLGGDEFVVLLVGLAAAEEYASGLNRLLAEISQPIEVAPGRSVSIGASIGVALYPEDNADADVLLRHADQAMYLAKQAGKGRYHVFETAKD
ncbi:MAG: hypothetical protein CVU17_05750 [Betaproteobacteria bacterium HGW-Betaproteobacteria-11]|nr:MAG: hypothetical protein CVU17_05750 [Betaproteobacteria bacterium HGW-Betaproteobacteria-11]